jgi:hypothetical protein
MQQLMRSNNILLAGLILVGCLSYGIAVEVKTPAQQVKAEADDAKSNETK